MDICGACGVQKNDAMVQCDRCDTWWHFGCVGVDESVSERSFICPKCENSTSLLQSQPTTGVELIPPIDSISLTSRRSSVSNASARARLNLEKLEVKKALAEKTLNLELREQERKLELARLQNEGELERKKLELQREYEEERIRLMEEELVEEEERSVRSQQSSSSKVRQWRSQLQFGGACSTMRYPAANEARGERNVKMTTTTTTAASDVPVSQPLNSTSRLTEEAANNHQQAGDGGNGFEVQALPKAKTCIGTGAVPKQLPTSTPTGEIVKSFPPPSMPSGSVPLRSPTPPAMANHPSSRFRISRTMPSWVTESSDRVGPAPPPPPVNMDPEYEVIDVANQQYSNTPPPIPVKSADIKRMTVMKCDLCGSVTPAVRCAQCDNNFFCASCDDRYHRHPKRQTHTRTPVELQTTPAAVAPTTTAVKPPLPPKGEAGTSGPLPPPRRNKRPGSFHFPSPLLGRKQDQDQTIPTTVPQGSISTQKPPQPPPSPALSLREKMNSLKRFIHPSNRPLPDPPENKIHSSTSSLDTVSKRSFSTGAPRSVSSTMEKIQNNTAATLDRMTMLQQRYRQHQETMRTDSDRSRRASLISNADMQSSSQTIRTKPPSVPSTILNQQQQQFHQQHLALQSRWNEPPTPRIRSGSVASGINLMPSASSPVPNESNAPSINNQSFMFPPQRTDLGGSPDPGLPNPRSTSVFNLNQMHQQPAQPNMWGFTPLQQAQSMAQMSFNQMGWNQMNPWMAGQTQNGSNMSLNMPSSQQGRYPPDPSRYPPGWNNAWGGMYPYPMGMMPMMHGMAMPPPRSRAHSRAASPALSIKSRKSTMSMRNRSSYINDLTDDEDSDEDFGKSRGRRDRRHRVNSNSSLDFDEPEPNSFVRASSVKHSRFNRDRRGTSSARSLIDYPTSYKRDIHRSKYDREELLRDRFDKMSLSSQRKVTSDSYTNDSDLETNRRGSNKSKPNNESLTTPRKITSDSLTNDSDGEIERRRVAKQSRSPSNVSSPMKVASDSFTNDSDAEFERRKQRKNSGLLSPKRMESDSFTGESDVGREKVKPVGIRKLSDTEKGKPVKPKASKTNPKKVPSDSHTPDTDGDQKRRFATKKPIKKNSSTEFIPNDSEPETDKQTEIKRKISIIVHEPPEIKSLSESNNENENDHSQSIEIKNQINETKPEAIQFTTEESPPPPPPIIAPNREWECAFCTYVNEAGVKICAICCKTVSVAVEAPTLIDPETPRSPPPDVVQEPPCEKRTVQNPTTDVKKLQTIIPPVAKEVDSKKKDNDDRFGGGVEQSDQVDEFLLEENQYENFEIQSALPVKLENPKGSGEIKQNLDSEVTKLVNKVVREKVSTGCGPSPPREFIEEKEAMGTVDSRPSSSARASIGTSPPPQDMSTQTTNNMNEAPTNGTKMMEPLSSNGQNSSAENEFINLLKEASHYNFTTDELQAALSLCKDKHPVLWLRDNWSKLVDTVQTLATKYGHEKRENTIGTISSAEAREALRLHKGNIWHAITECIEQRQKKYHEIASKGNFTREDIVTSLTAHHGNMDLAMVELSKTQLKPFLMRIWGPPNGADNDSGNSLLQQALKEDRSGISTEIQEFISTHVEKELLPDKASECLSTVEVEVGRSPEVKLHPNVEKTNHTTVNENGKCDVPDEESVTSNTLILRDIEKLIDQMEKNQENKNEDVLKNIQHLLTKLVEKSGSRPASQASVRSESCERIIVKSPIPLPRMNQPSESESKPIYEDIRNFMAENIQEVLPSLVDQVQQELRSVPIHTEKTLVDDIRETLMNADFSEEEYSVISNFPFNINDKDDMHDFPNIKKRSSMGFQTAQEDDNEYANIQDFIMRAIRTERLTNEFEQYKTNNYRFDSSSDEARNTAESADYYDIVAVNQRIQDLLNRNREVVTSLGSLEIEPPTSVDNPAEEAIYVNTAEINAFAATQHNSETSERKQVKKRRVSRIPVNKDNYLQRRPVKSSSESDFEAIAHNHKSPIPTVHVDHVEELRHVVENIEKIEQELDMLPNELDSPSADVVQPIYDNVVDTEEIIEVETQPTPEIITSEQQALSNHSLTCKNVPDTSLIIPLNHEPHDQSTSSDEINDTCEDVVSPHNVDHITEPSISPLHEVANSSIQSPVASVPLETPSVVVPEAVSQSPEPMLISPAEEPLQPLAASPTIIEIVDAPQLNTEPIKDEPVSISLPKPSNNLSDLVLDTKRLIQQMKDEIASDMATMEDEDDVYEDEYYEEDEYGDWTEGDEMMEEWDSNEEYDVDENGDFFEYEDEDDDGSVMFSEIAPEDVVHSVDQVEEKRIEESKPELPKINAAMVREMERNSASEVSDLPLDSDFNDTLSVIEQSFGEVTDILSLAVEGLTGNNQLDYDELSGADTVQNSPEISTISEVTLVADATDSTEATLVAEENMNLTMKNVQTLLNAKVVIGEFIKTAQHAGNSTVNLDPANQVQTGERTIHDLVQSGPSQSVAGVEKRATPEPHPQDSKIPETDTSDAMSNDAEQNHAEKETASATHVLDATIEMLNTVARDLSEQLQQVSPVPPIEEHNSQEIVATENNVPEYATVNRNRVTGHLVNLEVDQKLDHETPEYVNIKQLQNMPTENGSTSVQTVVNGADDTITNGQSIQSVQNSASPTVAQIVEGSITGVNLISSKETVFNQISSEEIISETVSSKVDEIENTLNLVALSEENTDSVITTLNLEEQSIQPTERTSSQIQESSIQHVINPNIVQTSMNQAQSTSINQEEVHKLLNPENTPSSIQLDLKDHVDEISSGEDASDVSIVASSTIHGQPDNNILAVHSEATHSVPPDNDSGHSSAITTDPDKRHTSDTTSTKDMSSPSNEQTLNNSVELHPVQNQIMETTRDSTTVFPAKTETLQSSSSNEDENTVEIVAEIINQISEIIQRSTVEEEIVPPILTNGVIHDATIRSSTSREPSEDSSSFIEVHASQVIIHSPNGEEPSSQSSSEALTQSSNIYENVKASSSTRKPSPKSSSKSIKTPGPGTAQTSSQSTTSKKLTTPSSSSSPSGQKTTKLVKAKTKATTEIKKNTSTTSDSSSRRNSLRKNSIGSPFGPMQINSVKNMQKEFLNKTQKDSSKSPTITPKPKPSKLVQPKAFINNKLTNPITIPTQPNVAASTSKASTSSSGEPGSSRSTPGPSSSKGTTPGGSREGSVTSEQKRKLRKKYMETCFSDDYFTSDEDDECTTTVTENTESRTIIRSLVKPFEPSEEPLEVQARRLLDEGRVMSYQQAELAIQLIEMRYAHENAVWAATQCHTIEEAKNLLQKECELCLGTYPMNEIISMLKCTHTCCLDCAKVYFTEEIMHRSITNCNCPYCKEPDLNNADTTEDDVLEYFSNLDILLKNIVDEEVHDLFQRKLRDRTLMQDPNFKWCVDCSSGFFARPRQKRLICPDCGSITCSSCRKPWESQHEGISCEQFAAWKEANDPELQAQGVARHLQAHGISCPNCKFKYSLSRGGCMHFTCTQCKFEFCFGCNKPFMMGAKCDVSPYCAKLGLHAHHPRNCLFYLRDKDPKDLQTLLTMHNVTYNTEPSELMKREFLEGGAAAMQCPIPIQRENPAGGLMDTVCNGDVPDGYAGLCRTHYVEYLVGAVSKAQIDPLPILDLTDCVQELRRRGIPLPERGPWDTDEIYREMCQKIVKEQIPLN